MGRPKGSKNKSPMERVHGAEAHARRSLAKSGVVMPMLAAQSAYIAQIKPGQRDLTDRFARIQVAIEDLERLDQIIKERAEHADMADIPGGKTGFVTFTYKRNADDGYAKVSQFDSALHSARESLLQYIAMELGQFRPTMEVHMRRDGTVGEKPAVDYSSLTVEELEFLQRIAVKLEAARGEKIVAPAEPEKDPLDF